MRRKGGKIVKKILCFGSLNIDYTYRVPHFVSKGETLAASSLTLFSGGKGLNQAIALAKAGAPVYMAGAIGQDGLFLVEQLAGAGVDVSFVSVRTDVRTGNAIIQNDDAGDNCILLYGGANRSITRAQVDEVLAHFSAGDFLLLQNEINELGYIIEQAHACGMRIIFNPSPMENDLLTLPLKQVDCFLVNEKEAAQLLQKATIEPADTEKQCMLLAQKFENAMVVLTLGENGAMLAKNKEIFFQPAYRVETVDTTGAGDTFSGFLIAGLLYGLSIQEALRQAAAASAIAVTRPGAAMSIPGQDEVADFLRERK